MAAKGTIAKENVVNILAKAFGKDFVGEFEKKVYVWADDGGEKVQIAITMTCPKVPIGNIDYSAEPTSKLDFENMSAAPIQPTRSAEIGEDEKANIEKLLAKFGL